MSTTTGRQVLTRLRNLRHVVAIDDNGRLSIQGELQGWLRDQVRENTAEIVYLLACDEAKRLEGTGSTRLALLQGILGECEREGLAAWWDLGHLLIDSSLVGRICVVMDARVDELTPEPGEVVYTFAEAAALEALPDEQLRAVHALKRIFGGHVLPRRQEARS